MSTFFLPWRARKQRALVHEVGEVGAGEARRAASEHLEVDVVGEGLARARGS